MRKFIKNIHDKLIDMLDNIAEQLGLRPKLVPVRVKKNKGRKR